MRGFIVGLVVGAVLAGGSAVAISHSSTRTVSATHGDLIRISMKRQLACLVGSKKEQGLACQRSDGHGYLVYVDADGSAAIRRKDRTPMTCLWPEAYCTSKP